MEIYQERKLFIKIKFYKQNMYVVNFGGEVDHGRIKETFRSHYIE